MSPRIRSSAFCVMAPCVGVLLLALMLIRIDSAVSAATIEFHPPRQEGYVDCAAILNETGAALGWTERVDQGLTVLWETIEGEYEDHSRSLSCHLSSTDTENWLMQTRPGPRVPVELHGMPAYRKIDNDPQGSYCYSSDLVYWTLPDVYAQDANLILAVFDQYYCEPYTEAASAADAMPYAEAMYEISMRHVLEANPSYISPDGIVELESNPYPEDMESVIQELMGAITNPAVPLAGAVAGTLLAALIAALRGAGQVPIGANTAVRGPKPGAVDAQGRLFSPVSGGWVSPQMYDYQRTWSEKGWRWNSSSGKFEGQHGAINEQGQVMDEELGWVDQKSFAENQRMRADGNVFDRNLGWRPPEELRDLHTEQDALRQRSRQFSAEQNAQIQQDVQAESQKRLQEYQDWLKQYEHKEQMRLDMDAAQDEFRRQRAIDSKLALKELLLKAAALPGDAADAVASRLCPPIGEVYQGAYDGVKEAAGDIKDFYKGTYDGLKETAGDIKDFYKGTYDGLKETAGDIKDFYKGTYDGLKETAGDIKDFYQDAYDELKETAGDVKDFYQGEIRDAYDGVKETAGDIKDLVYHDGIDKEWEKAISAKNWDWTPEGGQAEPPPELIR